VNDLGRRLTMYATKAPDLTTGKVLA